jgi:hypothetical protein
MGTEVRPFYDTQETIASKTTPDLLAQLLFEYLAKEAEEWVSVPEEEDPTGKRWSPHWTSISEAIREIDHFLNSSSTQELAIPGFSAKELTDELRAFRNELEAALAHTARFHLCVY